MAFVRKYFPNYISTSRCMSEKKDVLHQYFCCPSSQRNFLNSVPLFSCLLNNNHDTLWKKYSTHHCKSQRNIFQSKNHPTPIKKYEIQIATKNSQSIFACKNLLPYNKTKFFSLVRNKHLLKNEKFPRPSTFHNFHTSILSSSSDVPDYLVGIITEIECSDDEIDLNATDLEMEEEIMDFLTCRAIQYDEADSSFIVECTNCSSSCEGTAAHRKDIFIDKQSGYYVCPWCCSAGTWEELCQVLDSKQDCLSVSDLHTFLDSTLPLSKEFLSLLKTSPCKHLDEAVLRRYGCRSSEDGSRLVVPVYWPVNVSSIGGDASISAEPVGYFSISLLQENTQIVSRFIKNRLCAWSSLMVSSSSGSALTSSPPTEVVVTTSMIDALHLAQLDVPCVVIGSGTDAWEHTAPVPFGSPASLPAWGLAPSVKTVLLWRGRGGVLPYAFYKFVADGGIVCHVVSSWTDAPVHQLQQHEIYARLRSRERLHLNGSVMPVGDLRDQIYHRLKHPCEVRGVPWKRFPDLQRLLLGHRPGEVTVVSGPTGAGKTTFLAEYSLDLAQQGVTTLWASLEVSKERLCEVLLQQYSGTALPSDRASFDALWHAFRQLPLFFLDVHGQQPLDLIMEAMRESALVRGVRHVVVDNLQFMVGCQNSPGERWQHQDMAMAAFRSFATQYNCHVTLIVHPRKLHAGEMLSLQTIGGGARVTQEADNVLLLQVHGANPVSCRKAIEVVKNRYGGHLGVVPIKFQQESLTFSGFFRRSKETHVKKD